jgi:hypothetical protein
MVNALKFLKIYFVKIKFCKRKLFCTTENKQEVLDFSLPYYGNENERDLQNVSQKSDSPLNMELSCLRTFIITG